MIPETCFMLKSVSQVMRLCVCLPFKDLNHNFQFSKLSVKKLLRVRHGETPWEGHISPSSLLFLQETTWGSEEEAEQAPPPPCLWESEASYTFHSTLGQTRNHSPVCKPPILQDVDNLEQETTVTQTPTLLSPHTPLTRMGMERLQNTEAVLPAQACIKPHTPDDHRSGKGMLHFNLSKTSPFPTQPVMVTRQ